MGDDLKLLLGFKLDETSLNQELDKVKNRKTTVAVKATGLTELNTELNKINVDKLSSRFEIFNQKLNSNATKQYANDIDALRNNIQNLYSVSGTSEFSDEFKKVSAEATSFNAKMREAGATQKTLSERTVDNIKKFSSWMSMTTLIVKAVQVSKELVTAVVDVDTAMTNLKKVCDADDTALSNFFEKAKKDALELGRTLTDIIDSTAEFSRLGYSLEDSSELARVAALYQNVGDGITPVESSESIISTMKAFDIQAEEAESIIDKFNEVGNHFAISSAGIGEALQRSASALAAANTDLSGSIALQVGANNVIQDPDRVGNMWKTVSMRIRGAKTELEEAGEDTEGLITSTSELRDTIKGMTGFDIMADEDGTRFKSIYDIVIGIGEVWSKLSDVSQASLLEMLAGKHQGNALAAALTNIDDMKAAYETAENSMGSAQKEQDKYAESIQYTIDQIKGQAQIFATEFLDSDTVKSVATDFLEFFKSFSDSKILDFLSDVIKLVSNLTGGLEDLDTMIVKIGVGIKAYKSLSGASRGKVFPLKQMKYARQYSGGNTERVISVIVENNKRVFSKIA